MSDPTTVTLEDCCITVTMDAYPLLTLDAGDTDPFTGQEIGWPAPRVYWSNGVITDGRSNHV